MKKCYISLAFALCTLPGIAQDPVVKPVHAIPAETLKKQSAETKKLSLERNAILSAELSKDKTQVTITPYPAAAPPDEKKEVKAEKK